MFHVKCTVQGSRLCTFSLEWHAAQFDSWSRVVIQNAHLLEGENVNDGLSQKWDNSFSDFTAVRLHPSAMAFYIYQI